MDKLVDIVASTVFVSIITLVLNLHKYLNGGLDVVENRKTIKLQQALSFFFELLLAKMVNLQKIKVSISLRYVVNQTRAMKMLISFNFILKPFFTMSSLYSLLRQLDDVAYTGGFGCQPVYIEVLTSSFDRTLT